MTDKLTDGDDIRLDTELWAWGRWTNRDMMAAGIPPTHPKAASWQRDYRSTDDADLNDSDYVKPLTEEDVAPTREAIVRLMMDNMPAANILIGYYRDGQRQATRDLIRARFLLWQMYR